MDTILLVAGSVEWNDPRPVEARLAATVDRVGEQLLVLHTDQRGAARIAAAWCERGGVQHRAVPADYRYGWRAWEARYRSMLDLLLDARDRGVADVEVAVFRLPGDVLLRWVVDAAREHGIRGHQYAPAQVAAATDLVE